MDRTRSNPTSHSPLLWPAAPGSLRLTIGVLRKIYKDLRSFLIFSSFSTRQQENEKKQRCDINPEGSETTPAGSAVSSEGSAVPP